MLGFLQMRSTCWDEDTDSRSAQLSSSPLPYQERAARVESRPQLLMTYKWPATDDTEATVVVASRGIEINECNQKQTASQARAINTSKMSRAAGLLGQAWLELKRWRIKMQPQTKYTAFPHTADVHGWMVLGAWHQHAFTNRPLGQPSPIRADNLLAVFR
ncbi:hypothetical protein Q8A73_010162 [Channa argus]|nr:hypothetical protein Q8A73_010162 [Channa argus]